MVFTTAKGEEQTMLRIYAPSKHDDNQSTSYLLSISRDADFANDVIHHRSITGPVITLNHTPTGWFSRKQKAVIMSTDESDHRVIWAILQLWILIQRTIISLPMISGNIITEGLTDNHPALYMLFSLEGSKLSIFINLRHQFIQREIKQGRFSTDMCLQPIWKRKYLTSKVNDEQQRDFLFGCVSLGNEGACAT